MLVNEARGERWEHFEMGCAEFLLSSLTGDVHSELLWSRYPADPHKFESCGLYPRRDDDEYEEVEVVGAPPELQSGRASDSFSGSERPGGSE